MRNIKSKVLAKLKLISVNENVNNYCFLLSIGLIFALINSINSYKIRALKLKNSYDFNIKFVIF